MYYVYLIHQHSKLGQPQTDEQRAAHGLPPRTNAREYRPQSGHYIGKAKNLNERIQEHAANRGSHYMGAVNRAGIEWSVARTWEFETWEEAGEWERKLKRMKCTPDICPACNPGNNRANPDYQRGR